MSHADPSHLADPQTQSLAHHNNRRPSQIKLIALTRAYHEHLLLSSSKSCLLLTSVAHIRFTCADRQASSMELAPSNDVPKKKREHRRADRLLQRHDVGRTTQPEARSAVTSHTPEPRQLTTGTPENLRTKVCWIAPLEANAARYKEWATQQHITNAVDVVTLPMQEFLDTHGERELKAFPHFHGRKWLPVFIHQGSMGCNPYNHISHGFTRFSTQPVSQPARSSAEKPPARRSYHSS